MDEKGDQTKVVKEIIKKSGHQLHKEIVTTLEECGYKVEISPYYIDAHSDKPREVDVIARKEIPVIESSDEHHIELVLAIDCKYFQHSAVFWTFENAREKEAIKTVDCEVDQLLVRSGKETFRFLSEEKTARLFQYGSIENEPVSDQIYKAGSQTINGAIFAREHTKNPGLVYPLVIVSGPGKLYTADEPDKDIGSILVHFDYSYYKNRQSDGAAVREPFYVWFVRKEKIDNLLVVLEKEVNALRIQQQDIIRDRHFRKRMAEKKRFNRRNEAL